MLMFGHGRWRQRVALLAMDALPAAERAETAVHLLGCAHCAAALADLERVRDLMAADALASAAPTVPFETLEARVLARLRDPAPARSGRAPSWTLAPVAAAAVAVAIGGAWLAGRAPRTAPEAPPQMAEGTAPAAASPSASEAMLRRMERSLAREQAARYLAEAQDVLVTVAAGPPPCPRARQTVEIEDEVQRSRDLLDRRALVAGSGREEVASAEPVLAEVEEMLSQVAALPSCVRVRQLQALEREIERRRLLMKIDLMARELQG